VSNAIVSLFSVINFLSSFGVNFYGFGTEKKCVNFNFESRKRLTVAGNLIS